MNNLWFVLIPVITGLGILWIIYGYPIYAMLKRDKIELKKKEIELRILEAQKNE